MSRQEREACQAELDANPALRAALDEFKAQLERSAAAFATTGKWDEDAIEAAVTAITAQREKARAVYVAAGLDPDKADEAGDDE